MFLVVSYDIVSDRRRVRVMKALKGYGERVQKSVYECLIGEPQFLELKERIGKIINPEEDSVRYYNLCARCQGVIEFVGSPPKLDEEDYMIV